MNDEQAYAEELEAFYRWIESDEAKEFARSLRDAAEADAREFEKMQEITPELLNIVFGEIE